MKTTKLSAFFVIAFGAVALLSGCGVGGDNQEATSLFPVADDAKNVQSTGPESVNYQTTLSLAEVAAFYRDTLSAQGLTERTINTVENDTVVSLVMDGHESGKALVMQATALPDDMTNVNVRLEEI